MLESLELPTLRFYIKATFAKVRRIFNDLGKHDSTFLLAQEDGVVFREESGGNNERIGQYRFPNIHN